MEYKSIPIFTKSISGRKVAGFASIMGNIDSDNEIVHSGAFTKTIQERGNRIKHLWQHDMYSPPIATITDLREVGKESLPTELIQKYPDVTGGLLVEREYLDTARANEVLSGIKSDPPAITEMSFAFDVVKYDFETNNDGVEIRNLRELRLWETSDVIWGANDATMASKSLLGSAVTFNDIETIQSLSRQLFAGELAIPQKQLRVVYDFLSKRSNEDRISFPSFESVSLLYAVKAALESIDRKEFRMSDQQFGLNELLLKISEYLSQTAEPEVAPLTDRAQMAFAIYQQTLAKLASISEMRTNHVSTAS